MTLSGLPEPWLRGTRGEVPAVLRGALHALDLAREDIERFCAGLSLSELNARPFDLPSVAFQLKHTARSLDRLLTYAEGRSLSQDQLSALRTELEDGDGKDDLFAEFYAALEQSAARIAQFDVSALEDSRRVGKKGLPTTLGGLLVHVADHTQRHTGQAVTTAKILLALRK